MDLNHLHLHVRDLARTRAFYARYFGFSHDGVKEEGFLIVRNDDGFDLALQEDADPRSMPPWHHFGFRLPGREAVLALHDRMAADRVTIARAVEDHGTWMSFRCSDPDGYAIEVYCE